MYGIEEYIDACRDRQHFLSSQVARLEEERRNYHEDAERLEALLDRFQAERLTVSAIDVEVTAIARACAPLAGSQSSAVAVLDVGWKASRLVVIHRGAVAYDRTLVGDPRLQASVPPQPAAAPPPQAESPPPIELNGTVVGVPPVEPAPVQPEQPKPKPARGSYTIVSDSSRRRRQGKRAAATKVGAAAPPAARRSATDNLTHRACRLQFRLAPSSPQPSHSCFRFASTRARRASCRAASNSSGMLSPVLKYISSGVRPGNAEWGRRWS